VPGIANPPFRAQSVARLSRYGERYVGPLSGVWGMSGA
jgi:hypothetical protein